MKSRKNLNHKSEEHFPYISLLELPTVFLRNHSEVISISTMNSWRSWTYISQCTAYIISIFQTRVN
jgi:hypothetical protein